MNTFSRPFGHLRARKLAPSRRAIGFNARPRAGGVAWAPRGPRWAPFAAGAAFAFAASTALEGPHRVACAPAKQKDFSTSLFTPRKGAIPIPALLMLKQIQEPFARDFPNWELPATFTRQMDYFYEETGPISLLWPQGAWIRVPIFERMSDAEEKALGESGRRKEPVATCYVRATCKAACAEVHIVEVRIVDAVTGEAIWGWGDSQ
ncbi:hypothetical protein DFJ74DRAFT_683472 [Hyaloraphidium curvatum]|nr:hypothetical protein DFJ74DRAFT_683472 [Hyaloraphidium curvatum]